MTPTDLKLGVEKTESGPNSHRSNHSLRSSQHRPVSSAEQWSPAERAGGLVVFAHKLQAVFAAFVFAGQLRERSCVRADDVFAGLFPHPQISHESRVARQVEEGERSGEGIPDCVLEGEAECPEFAGLVLAEQSHASREGDAEGHGLAELDSVAEEEEGLIE